MNIKIMDQLDLKWEASPLIGPHQKLSHPKASLLVGMPLETYTFNLFQLLLWQPWDFVRLLAFYCTDVVLKLPPLAQLVIAVYAFFLFLKFCRLAYTSYQAFLDLGRGGTPSTWWGWWRVTRLKYCAALPNVLDPPHVPPLLEPYRGLLERIPSRQGNRPTVQGVAPQRQVDQKAPRSTYILLHNLICDLASQSPDRIYVDTSFLEKHTKALFAKPTEATNIRDTTAEFGYEICHPHKNDGSLHMIMHPEDVRTVIEGGWGERHPLARSDWWWMFYFHEIKGHRPPVPETLVLIYAPRNSAEIVVVKEFIRAAAWWITGVDLGKKESLRNLH